MPLGSKITTSEYWFHVFSCLIYSIYINSKILKLYAWEPSFKRAVGDVRESELLYVRNISFLNALSYICWFLLPFLVSASRTFIYQASVSFAFALERTDRQRDKQTARGTAVHPSVFLFMFMQMYFANSTSECKII